MADLAERKTEVPPAPSPFAMRGGALAGATADNIDQILAGLTAETLAAISTRERISVLYRKIGGRA